MAIGIFAPPGRMGRRFCAGMASLAEVGPAMTGHALAAVETDGQPVPLETPELIMVLTSA